MDKMNVYQKLNEARIKIASTEIKKSGYNKHLKFAYSELEDFINVVLKVNSELGILSQFVITNESASITITNCDKPEEQIVFESPVAHAKLSGAASPIQELGSQHTYMRRYLYQMVYEITEADTQDASIGQPEPIATAEQIASLITLASTKGVPSERITASMKKRNADADNCPIDVYNGIYASINKMPDNEG